MAKAVAWNSAKLAARKLEPVFARKGWEWVVSDSTDAVPCEQEIEDEFMRLQKDMLKNKNIFAATGRLAVVKRGKVFIFGLEKYLRWCEDDE